MRWKWEYLPGGNEFEYILNEGTHVARLLHTLSYLQALPKQTQASTAVVHFYPIDKMERACYAVLLPLVKGHGSRQLYTDILETLKPV